MNILVHELMADGLFQKIRIGAKNVNLMAVRPHLYLHNAPAGGVTLQIQNSNGIAIAESDAISVATMKAGVAARLGVPSGGFDHGYFRFYVNAQLRKDTEYRVALMGSGGYSFSGSAFVGWCNDFDLRKVTAEWSPSTSGHAALDMELWSRNMFNRRAR